MTDLDAIIVQCVEDIWDKFDHDKNGTLDFIECRKLVNFILGRNARKFSDEEFKMIFKEFDKDGDETISRTEMAYFLK